MTTISILLLAVALAADAFSVALAAGGSLRGPRATFRLSFHFGLFQAIMPALGAISGSLLHGYVSAVDHWIAFGLLAAIGIRMVVASFGAADGEDGPPRDPSRGWILIGLSVATSIDAFGAGIGLAMTEANLLVACLVIGVVTAALVLVAVRLGRLFHRRLGPWAERFGGLVLVGLAIHILITG